MGAKSRRKGATGEREVVELARKAGFGDAKRTAPMQAGYGGNDFPDVDGVQGLYIEVKKHARVPVNKLSRELLDGPPRADGHQVVIVWRDDGMPAGKYRATLDAGFLLSLWKELGQLREAVHLVAQGTGVQA